MMTTNVATVPGWYAIFPEGGGIVAIKVNAWGALCDSFEHGVWLETFRRANDRRRWVADAIEAGRTVADVPMRQAARILAAWDRDADPMCCIVERVIEEDTE